MSVKNIKKKKSRSARLPLFGLLLGIMVMAIYPLSEIYDSYRRSKIVESMDRPPYVQKDDEKEKLLTQAKAYNAHLAQKKSSIPYDEIWPYKDQLNMAGDDAAFSAVIIPRIALTMPIYHGTDKEVLSAGVGHLEGTSLPVGGSDTHTVVSAHSGLATMRAFDDIRELEKGDLFGFRTLGDDYVYEIDDIKVVLPNEMQWLDIVPDQDRATLVTCTPYGINDHRLLVSGHRVETPENWNSESRNLPSVSSVVTNLRVWPFLVAVVFVVLLIAGNEIRLRQKRKKKLKKGQMHDKEN